MKILVYRGPAILGMIVLLSILAQVVYNVALDEMLREGQTQLQGLEP